MKNIRATLDRELGEVWSTLQKETRTLGCELRPKRHTDAATVSEDGGRVTFEFKPLCMKVTEKAYARNANLYVAIAGRAVFEMCEDKPRSINFASSAAYFREMKTGSLKHVFAMHYDHVRTDEKPVDFGHPTFHAQIKAAPDKFEVVNDRFHTDFEAIRPEDDLVQNLLSNARLPTANMDPLCIILQVLGDHVVNVTSSDQNKESFRRSRDAVAKFRSDLSTAAVLNAGLDARCLRGPHWYVT